jgi:hypothetical protein
MSNRDDYRTVLPALEAMGAGDVEKPRIAMGAVVSEAEQLHQRAAADREVLLNSGLHEGLLDSLPVRVGALIHAHGALGSQRTTAEEARVEWQALQKRGGPMRYDLIRTFRFAYHHSANMLRRIEQIERGRSRVETVQDLVTLVALGEQNPRPLEVINFDMQRLRKAYDTAEQMSAALARCGAIAEDSLPRQMRDRAYTYLMQAVREVRRVARFAFHGDRDSLRAYASEYNRVHRGGKGKERAVAEA